MTSTEPSPLTRSRLMVWACLLLAILVITGFACTLLGHHAVGGQDTWQWPPWTSPVWVVRVFRLLAAMVVGAALATAGMATQALLRNPMAEPYLLGISSGAGVGVLIGMWAADRAALPSWATTPVLAFGGALVTTLVVYQLGQRHGRIDPLILLLSGAIVNVFNGALILLVLQFSRSEQMVQFISWGMGQMPEWLWSSPKLLILCGGIVFGGWAGLFLRGMSFNALGLGDEVAASSGVPVHRLRLETFIIVSLMTAAAVSLAGPIGFVGLIVPHMCRLLVGPDHRILAVMCGFGGALFLMLADTLCRLAGVWGRMGELPVGIVTALSGGPFFIVLLRRKLRGEGP